MYARVNKPIVVRYVSCSSPNSVFLFLFMKENKPLDIKNSCSCVSIVRFLQNVLARPLSHTNKVSYHEISYYHYVYVYREDNVIR